MHRQQSKRVKQESHPIQRKRFRCPEFDDDNGAEQVRVKRAALEPQKYEKNDGKHSDDISWWSLRRYSTLTCTTAAETRRTSISWGTDSNGNALPVEIRLFDDSCEETMSLEDTDASQGQDQDAYEEDMDVENTNVFGETLPFKVGHANALEESNAPDEDAAIEETHVPITYDFLRKARRMPEPLLDISEEDDEDEEDSHDIRMRYLPGHTLVPRSGDTHGHAMSKNTETPTHRKISMAINSLYSPMAPCRNGPFQRMEC